MCARQREREGHSETGRERERKREKVRERERESEREREWERKGDVETACVLMRDGGVFQTKGERESERERDWWYSLAASISSYRRLKNTLTFYADE